MKRSRYITALAAVAGLWLCTSAFTVFATVTAQEGTSGSNCTVRLQEFIDELDRLLAGNPRSIDPIFALLKTYFPLKACNIEEAIKICRQSRYLVRGFGGQPRDRDRVHTILFSNAGYFGHSGFQVQFSLSKETGDSIYPFALANK
jgi:hypothetical protein